MLAIDLPYNRESASEGLLAAHRNQLETDMPIDSRRSRWHITARVVLATFGGYLFANSLSLFIVFALPVSRLSAIITMTFLTFLLWTAASMWVFSTDRIRSATIGLLGSSVVFAAGAILLYSPGDGL